MLAVVGLVVAVSGVASAAAATNAPARTVPTPNERHATGPDADEGFLPPITGGPGAFVRVGSGAASGE